MDRTARWRNPVPGLARGGVPVAAEAATALRLPWDVLPVCKLGVPGHGETAFGALAPANGAAVRVLNRDPVDRLLAVGVSRSALDEVESTERAELLRRAGAYQGPRLPLGGRTVIVIDDGLATGATMRAAVEAVRATGAATAVDGVPVASLEAQTQLERLADAVVSLFVPGQFREAGSYYRTFRQVRDDDVVRLLDARPA